MTPIHIRPHHSGIICVIQLKMEPNSSSLIHHSIDIHLVALPQTYTEIYRHLYNVSGIFGRVYIEIKGGSSFLEGGVQLLKRGSKLADSQRE